MHTLPTKLRRPWRAHWSASARVAAAWIVAKKTAVVVPHRSSRATHLAYTASASAASAILDSAGKVYLSSHCISGRSVAVPV